MYISFCLHPAICGNCGQPARTSKPVGLAELSHVDPLCSLFDLFKAEKRPVPCSRTGIADFFPRGRAFQVRIPERPGPTLDWPCLVDRAIPRLRVKKRAVSVRKLCQRNSAADDASVKQADFSDRLIEILGDFQQFIIRHPDDSRSTCTAVSALSTRELQPVLEPWAGCLTRFGVACFRHFSSSNYFHVRNWCTQCTGPVSARARRSQGFRYFLDRPVRGSTSRASSSASLTKNTNPLNIS